MEHLPTSPPPMPLSIDIARWAVNGDNIDIPSTWACMHQNLTWLEKTHAFIMWEGFKAQGCMLFPHNLWDHPRFHQRSSCNLIVIICHSHQRNCCWNSLELSWNAFQLTSLSPIPLSTDVRRWVVNGANLEIPSTCAYMRQNLTWLDKAHAFTVWEGFKTQGYMVCLHNIWDHPHLHQWSWCNLIVIICHSHIWNLCRNSLEMSWNVFQQAHHQCHDPPIPHVGQWMGPTLWLLQIVHVCIKIWHG